MTAPTSLTGQGSDPLQTIYAFLSDALHLSAQSDATLAFLNPATMIDPAAFKLHPQDTALNPALATQEFSRLTNVLFTLDGASASPRLEHLSVQYEMLLAGAQPLQAGALDILGAVRRVAQQLFEDNKVGFQTREGEPPILAQYHPSYGTPGTWYDPAATQNWLHFSTGASDTTPAPTPSPRPWPPRRLPRLEFKVLPEELRPALQKPDLLPTMLRQVQLSRVALNVQGTVSDPPPAAPPSPATGAATTVSPGLLGAMHLTALSSTPVSALAFTRAATLSPAAIIRDHRGGLEDEAAGVIIRDHRGDPPPAGGPIVRDHRPPAEPPSIPMTPVLTQVVDSLPTSQVSSSSLNIAFEYCLVQVDRPWFSAEYLQTPGWFLPGYRAGDLGAHASGTGPLASIPTHLVFTRNISISGQWSPQDIALAQQSLALGPFNLLGGSFDQQQTTFTCPGLFLLGVVLHRLPPLPPAGDPSLPPLPPTPDPVPDAAPDAGSSGASPSSTPTTSGEPHDPTQPTG